MIKAQSHKLVNTQLGYSDLFAKWIEIVSKGTSLFSFICVSYFFSLLSYGFFQKHILQAFLGGWGGDVKLYLKSQAVDCKEVHFARFLSC